MSDKDQTTDDSHTPEITRRATFKLATAVAAFGAAMGMQASTESAAKDMFLKRDSQKINKSDGAEKQKIIKKDTGQEKQEILKNTRK